jgi:hypothetical protein
LTICFVVTVDGSRQRSLNQKKRQRKPKVKADKQEGGIFVYGINKAKGKD